MKQIKKWDVDYEESIRVDLPANDCRRFNGGGVAPPSVTKFWPKEGEKPGETPELPIKVIDRLRY